MQTIEFTTPQQARVPQPVDVDLCGSHWTVHRPKDAVLLFASVATSSQVTEQDRSMAILNFMRRTLDSADLKEWTDRVKDERDPLDDAETATMIGQLVERWNVEPDTGDYDDSSITVTAESERPDDPITARVVSQDRVDELDSDERDSVDLVAPMDLDIDLVFTRPKRMVGMITHSGMSTDATTGDLAFSIGFFLDSALPMADAAVIETRWGSQDPDDLMDIRPMADIVTALLQLWESSDRTNRAQRRAAAKQPKKRPGNPGGNKRRSTGAKSPTTS